MKINNKDLPDLLLVDLDDTLIDTSVYKSKLFPSLSKTSGLSEKEIRMLYESIKKDSLLGEGWVLRLATKISQTSNSEIDTLLKCFYENIKYIKINNALLNYIKRLKVVKMLLTTGDFKHQSEKIRRLKLSKYFNKIIIVPGSKSDYFKSRITKNGLKIENSSYYNVMLIDDRTDLLARLQNYPWLKVVHPNQLIL